MNRIFLTALLSLFLCSCVGGNYKYETVSSDPTNTQIYTLENGLKVYLSVNKDQPRVQTLIGVKVGGKNDPAENSGLAHYFEHLMFKGTDKIGTLNYEKEKPLLDQIELEFEKYRTLSDSSERVAQYKVIDSLSFEASRYSAANEYDKLMKMIGARATNAWTSYDQTVFTDDIPSNEIETWAKIASERFKNSVIRGFHTELETVYEEKNMSLTNDMRKTFEALSSILFKKHPYGTQTVLGTQQTLKNPSITAIKNYYKQWYVPNNIAISLSGDFEPDRVIEIIESYFGDLKPNPELPKLEFEAEDSIIAPIRRDVWGQESPLLLMGYRFDGANSKDMVKLKLLDALLNNGEAGLIDLNIVQKQRLLSAMSGVNAMSDYSIFMLLGVPKEGQSLEEVEEILLGEIESLKNGEFDEKLLTAVINNYKLAQIKALESNSTISNMHIDAFTNSIEWSDVVSELDTMSKITKDELVEFVKANFNHNYGAIYKMQGKDKNEETITKPKITPILTNRDSSSQYLQKIAARESEALSPQFADFTKDLSISTLRDSMTLLYKQNLSNELFELDFVLDFGSNHNKFAPMAAGYFNYLSTSKYSNAQIKEMLYTLACSYNIAISGNKTVISLSGLGENFDEALSLLDHILTDIVSDENALKNLKADILKSRADQKLSQQSCFAALRNYVMRGAEYVKAKSLKDDEILAVSSDSLVNIIESLKGFGGEVRYYGAEPKENLVELIDKNYSFEDKLICMPKEVAELQNFDKNVVYIAPYDAAQSYFTQITSENQKFDPERESINRLYNSYFGGGMNSIVFQEMREARALAYSAAASLIAPSNSDDSYFTTAFIATQNDKLIDAIAAFESIINDMPLSQKAFDIAKESLITDLNSSRITKNSIFNSYKLAQNRNLDYDLNKKVYQKLPSLTLEDVSAYQKEYVKDKNWHYAILGDKNRLDIAKLKEYGEVKELTLEDVFGY